LKFAGVAVILVTVVVAVIARLLAV